MDLDLNKSSVREINAKLRKGFSGNILNSASRIHVLAIGLKTGNLNIKGDAGDYIGALNDGCKIRIDGKAGRFLADNMTSGEVIANGCGYGAGTGMYGGTLLIRGNAGSYAGQINKGGTILVDGNIGNRAGLYMLNGSIVVTKDAGDFVGDYIENGNIYVGGKISSIGNNAKMDKMNTQDISFLHSLFKKYNVKANSSSFKKVISKELAPVYKGGSE